MAYLLDLNKGFSVKKIRKILNKFHKKNKFVNILKNDSFIDRHNNSNTTSHLESESQSLTTAQPLTPAVVSPTGLSSGSFLANISGGGLYMG